MHRIAAAPVALLVQDTTDDDESLNLGPKGVGTLKHVDTRARRLHPTLAFTPTHICLGVVHAAYWARDEPSPRAARRRPGRGPGSGWYSGCCVTRGWVIG